MRSYKLCMFGLLFAVVVVAAGCGDDETVGPAGRDGIPDAFVVGYISRMDDVFVSGAEAVAAAPAELIECTSRVSVSNVLSLPGVSINGTELYLETMPRVGSSIPSFGEDPVEYPLLAIGPAGGGLAYYGRVWIDDEENAHLVVEYGKPDGSTGTAEAAVCVPGPFSILDVSDEGNITPTTSVTGEWSSSDNAERYYIYGSYSCNYRTLSAETAYLYGQCDTVVTDTVFVFQGEYVFPSPPDLDYFVSLDAYFYIMPVCGPIETGDDGNVTGDGEGFFTGFGPSRSIHIFYTMPRAGAVDAYEKY